MGPPEHHVDRPEDRRLSRTPGRRRDSTRGGDASGTTFRGASLRDSGLVGADLSSVDLGRLFVELSLKDSSHSGYTFPRRSRRPNS
ncbi:pentapeptide repeat-containing protein [Natronorubrum tibetense]|uniref:pentapeptide repeat-containing protein n=1 Tax=Natronorubrum tibetense TaxID=63128 RepID=UPI001268DF06